MTPAEIAKLRELSANTSVRDEAQRLNILGAEVGLPWRRDTMHMSRLGAGSQGTARCVWQMCAKDKEFGYRAFDFIASLIELSPYILEIPNAFPALLDLAESQQWRPIASAPKDGTRVDLWVRDTDNSFGRTTNCFWHNGAWVDERHRLVEFKDARNEVAATHWCALPEPPKDLP